MRFWYLTAPILLAASCSGGGDARPLKVYAASSLAEVLPDLDGEALYQFAGSDDLALQLREGAEADVFAAASSQHPTSLHEAGVVDAPVVFATNELVLIVPRTGVVDSVEDLADPGVKLVIGAEGVPIGDYTRQLLKDLGSSAVLEQVVSEEEDVKGVLAKVRLGEADAGIVYATDAKPVEDEVVSIELPAEAQPVIEYMVAVVSGSAHVQEAQAFIDRLLGSRGGKALRAAGFGVP
ncbi:MAG: molybdate ABC transporter substrate-binding protein [Actinomycetota bacterium]|nr:molybdate ABC transporter substrate-binding protein [Actinomycetota bacterium]